MAPTVADYLLERLRAWDVRARVRLPGRRDQRHPRGLGPGGEQAAVRPGAARGDGRLRGGRVREVHRAGRRVHGDVRPGRHPPAQRPVRRQAGPRAGGRDRRADQPQRDGRLLPAGSRPALAVQGRRQRLRADGHGPRAAAQRAGPGDQGRAGRACAHRHHHPLRRAGTRLLGADPRVQDGPVVARRRLGDHHRRRPRGSPRRPRSSTPAARSPSWPARARAAPGPSSSRSPTCSAPGWPSRCWARTCCPTSCPT